MRGYKGDDIAHRRNIREIVLSGIGVVSVGLAAWMLHAGIGDSIDIATIAALFVGIAALALAAADYFRSGEETRPDVGALADDLATTIQEQWLEEAKARKLRDPRVLPLSWSATRREVSDSPEAMVHGQAPAGRVTRLNLDGRLDGRFDEANRRLAGGYRQVPSGRLVVLGEPGAGKTVLAIMLTLGLLDTREAGSPVPVLLTAASWDPVTEPLDDWVVRTLATTYYTGRQEIPRRLLGRGLLLPVLDGLDEIPESARRGAVRGINHAVGADRPVVVTCRSAEYEDVVEGGAPVLRRAPVVEVAPVPADDVIAYLAAVGWPEGTVWDAVYEHLRTRPAGPVATALSTPLMVSLARMVYQRCGGDPAELLDPEQFDCRHAVEDYLSDRVIDAAYAPERLPSGQPVRAEAGRWDAAQARRWLTFLARYLHQHSDRDLAWWRLAPRLLSPWAVTGIGIGAGTVLMATISTVASGDEYDTPNFGSALGNGAGFGTAFVVLFMIIWYSFAGRAPGRLSFAVRGSLSRLRRGFVTGLGLTAIVVLPPLTAVAVVFSLRGGWSLENFLVYFIILAAAAAAALVIGLALAAHNWLDAPPERSARASPHSLIRHDRLSSLVGASVAGAVVGMLAFPALVAGILVGWIVGLALTGWPGWPGRPDLVAAAPVKLFGESTDWVDGAAVLFLGFALALLGAVFALLVLLTRAWPRFVVARALLAARGHVPWRLLSFLADARERGLLRQSGGTYQFQHIRLQERLVDQSPATNRPPIRRSGPAPSDSPSPARSGRRGRVLAVATAAAVVFVVLAWPIVARPVDSSQTVLSMGSPYADINKVVFSLDGRTLATTSRRVPVQLWDTYSGQPIGEPRVAGGAAEEIGEGIDMVFSPDGRTLAASGYNVPVRLWDVSTGRLSGQPGDMVGSPAGYARVVENGRYLGFTDDGHVVALLATVSYDATVQVWDEVAGQRIGAPLIGHIDSVSGIVFSPGGHMIATASYDDTVRLWDVATGRPVGDPLTVSHAGGADRMEFSPDGRTLATVSVGEPVRLWDVTTGRLDVTTGRLIDTPLTVSDGYMEFSPDGRTLAVNGYVDVSDRSTPEVRLWDVATGRSLGIPIAGKVTVMEFSPDGRILATAGYDHAVRLWAAGTGRPIGDPLIGHTGAVTDIAFSPDGRTLATAGSDATARLWDLTAAGTAPR